MPTYKLSSCVITITYRKFMLYEWRIVWYLTIELENHLSLCKTYFVSSVANLLSSRNCALNSEWINSRKKCIKTQRYIVWPTLFPNYVLGYHSKFGRRVRAKNTFSSFHFFIQNSYLTSPLKKTSCFLLDLGMWLCWHVSKLYTQVYNLQRILIIGWSIV